MHWTLTPLSYGRGVDLRAVGAASPRMNANRVQYNYEQLTEWYAGSASGLEQGFTLAQAPAGLTTDPVTVAMRLPKQWSAELDENRLGLTLRGTDTQFRYAGLFAKDAAGKALRIWLDLQAGRLLLNLRWASASGMGPLRFSVSSLSQRRLDSFESESGVHSQHESLSEPD
jgi:hypothetical protein